MLSFETSVNLISFWMPKLWSFNGRNKMSCCIENDYCKVKETCPVDEFRCILSFVSSFKRYLTIMVDFLSDVVILRWRHAWWMCDSTNVYFDGEWKWFYVVKFETQSNARLRHCVRGTLDATPTVRLQKIVTSTA